MLKKASDAVRGEYLLSRGRGMCETEQGGKTNEGSTWGGDMAKGRGVRKIRSSLCKVQLLARQTRCFLCGPWIFLMEVAEEVSGANMDRVVAARWRRLVMTAPTSVGAPSPEVALKELL